MESNICRVSGVEGFWVQRTGRKLPSTSVPAKRFKPPNLKVETRAAYGLKPRTAEPLSLET